MKASYPMKVQVIRSKKQPPRFYVNLQLPLAAALGIEGGEEVHWQLLHRTDLRLRRPNAGPADEGKNTVERAFSVFSAKSNVDSAATSKGVSYRPITLPSALARMRHAPQSIVKQIAVGDHDENGPENRGFAAGSNVKIRPSGRQG